MPKKLLTSLLLIVFCTLALGQNGATISGHIAFRWNKNPISFANLLLVSQDESVTNGAISMEDGHFSFPQLEEGVYHLSVSFMGFTPDTIRDIQLSANESVVLDTIYLRRLKNQLEEINIIAERPMIEESAGKTTLNVNEQMSGSGESALELIKYLPSASTDEDDNVVLRGAPATIMIDGVETDMANALDALPVGMIDKIEVMTNPSAKYSSRSGAGIINIILKGEKKKGANGKVYVGAGTPQRLQTGGNMILMHKKWTAFSNVDYSHFIDEKRSASERTYKDPTVNSVLFTTSQNDMVFDKINIRQGFKYQIDQSSSLRLDANYRKDRNTSKNNTNAKKIDDGLTLISQNASLTDAENAKTFWNTSLDYRKEFKDASQLAVLLRYELQDKLSPMDKHIAYYNVTDGTEKDNYQTQRRSNPEKIGSWRLKADYEKDLNKRLRIESGLLLLQRRSDAENDFVRSRYNLDEGTDTYITTVDSSQVYNFKVNELTPSAYAMFYYTHKDWNISGGLRYELMHFDVQASSSDSSTTSTYHNVLPSLHLTRQFSDKFSTGFSASYRSKMPNYRQLSPVAVYNGLYSKNLGNPKLRPEKITNLELSGRYVLKKHRINTGLFYKHFSDMINRQQYYEEEEGYDVLVRQYQNIGKVKQWGIDMNISSTLPWKIRAKTNFLLMGQDINSVYKGQELHLEDWTWSAKLTANKTMWKDLRWQLTTGYFSDSKTLTGVNYASFYSNVGLSKAILKRKGTLSLQVNDIFDTVERRRFNNASPKYDNYTWNKGITRKVLLSFSYKFNTNMKK